RAGDAEQAELGLGIDLDRRLAIQAHARNDLARIIRGELELGHLTHLDAVVLHQPALRQAGHRFGEDDIVIAEFAVGTGLGQPQHEAEPEEEGEDREAADEDMVGACFHGQGPAGSGMEWVCVARRAARPRGPWKYSWIHGSSTCSTTSSVSATRMRFFASTATRSQIVYSVSRS